MVSLYSVVENHATIIRPCHSERSEESLSRSFERQYLRGFLVAKIAPRNDTHSRCLVTLKRVTAQSGIAY